ncbi:MAG: hypothetical protein NVSMB64_14220 [Candidatus Velthaea sp.]
MRNLRAVQVGMACMLLAACGGGGSGSTPPVRSVQNAVPSVLVSPVPEAPASIEAAPDVAPAAAIDAGVPVVNSTSAPRVLADNASVVIGYEPYGVETSAPGKLPIDGLPCTYGMAMAQHFHAHFSFYVNGRQYGVPGAVGIYHPKVVRTPYFYDANGATGGCNYDMHTHTPDGVIHIESGSSKLTFNLRQFLDIWHVTLTSNSFWHYTGPTRVFLTDEATGGPGTHPVREITGQNFSTILMKRHMEITVEVGPTYVNTPNYTFYGGL